MTDKELSEILIYIGITPEKQGYTYLKLVIDELSKKPTLKLRSAYDIISVSNHVNSCTLDSSIRNAIHAAHDSGKLFRLNKLIGIDVIEEKICPTNRELIMLIVNHLKFINLTVDTEPIGA